MKKLNLYTFSELKKRSAYLANIAIHRNDCVISSLDRLADIKRREFIKAFNDDKTIQAKLDYFCLVFAPGINRPIFDGSYNEYADIIINVKDYKIEYNRPLEINNSSLYNYIKSTKEYKTLSYLDKARIKWGLKNDDTIYTFDYDNFYGATGIEKIDNVLDGFMYDLTTDFYNWLLSLVKSIPDYDYIKLFNISAIGYYMDKDSTLRDEAIKYLDARGHLFDNTGDFICYDNQLKNGNIINEVI